MGRLLQRARSWTLPTMPFRQCLNDLPQLLINPCGSSVGCGAKGRIWTLPTGGRRRTRIWTLPTEARIGSGGIGLCRLGRPVWGGPSGRLREILDFTDRGPPPGFGLCRPGACLGAARSELDFTDRRSRHRRGNWTLPTEGRVPAGFGLYRPGRPVWAAPGEFGLYRPSPVRSASERSWTLPTAYFWIIRAELSGQMET